MNWTIKISAYTLTEVLVVLALTTVVAALSFSALGFVKKSLGLVNSNYETANIYRNIELQLSLDFANSETIEAKTENGVNLITPLQTTTYSWQGNHLIKNQDTMYSGSARAEYFLNGKNTTSGTIDAIKLYLTLEQKEVAIFVRKPISTKDYLTDLGN